MFPNGFFPPSPPPAPPTDLKHKRRIPQSAQWKPVWLLEIKFIKVQGVPKTVPSQVFNSLLCLCWASSNLSVLCKRPSQHWLQLWASAPGTRLVSCGSVCPPTSPVFRQRSTLCSSLSVDLRRAVDFLFAHLFSSVRMGVINPLPAQLGTASPFL